MKISIVIPFYNDNFRIKSVLDKLSMYKEVILIDDCSKHSLSETLNLEIYANLIYIRNNKNLGYIESIKKGIDNAKGDIIVTMDADGEHDPLDINRLVEPLLTKDCDIVFGKRDSIARVSERFLLKFARFLTHMQIKDSGSGFRAIRAKYAKELDFYGTCTCGTLLVECSEKKMKICEVKVKLPSVDKPRKIAWNHFKQFFLVCLLYAQYKVKGLHK